MKMTKMGRLNIRRQLPIWVVGAIAVVVYIAWGAWPPRRPGNVPKDAVFVETAKTGWWQFCVLDAARGVNRCQVFDKNGTIEQDEDYLPYDGGTAAASGELIIAHGSNYVDAYRIILRNGRILLPKSMYDDQKRFLDSWNPFPKELQRTWSAGEK